MSHWTDYHITQNHMGDYMAWDEVGQLLDTYGTREEAKTALIKYDEALNAANKQPRQKEA